MKIKFLKKPFPHVIVKNFLTQKQYKEVFDEVIQLIPLMEGPEITGAASTSTKGILKKGKGIFLDDFFIDLKRAESRILVNFTKLFDEKIMSKLQDADYFFKYYYPITTRDFTLLQMYGDGDHYLPHADTCLFSSITLLHKEPKKYEGGELLFTDYDYNVNLNSNDTVIFPSRIVHEVLKVTSSSQDITDNRFTITKFMHFETLKQRKI